MRTNKFLGGATILLAAALIFSVLSCSKKSTNNTSGIVFLSTPNITLSGSVFSPRNDSVAVGTIITWTNNDGVNHTVTSNAGTELFSPTISPGKTYVDTMNTPGIFGYHCNFHSFMTGTVKVQ